MNIKSLEIYGYGRLQQRKYQLNRSFTQIYGENETGKSTMQLFIHSILFGFPGPDEPKLMPRFAATYGGNLLIETNGEELFIERVYRNQKEELTVRYQKQQKDAAWLTQKLNFITKETYSQIFSFDVLRLQHVHQLTEDKLQNYLLQAGVFGATAYSSLESTLEDEKLKIITDDHESGELYDHVLELTNLEIQMREEKNKLRQYDIHESRAHQLTSKIDLLHSHIEQLTDIQQRKQKEMMFHADMKEWKQLEHQLNIEPVVFPDNGIERYESLKRQNYDNEREIMLRAEKVNQMAKEAGIELMPDTIYHTAQELLKEEPVIKEHEKVLNHLDRDILDKQAAMHAVQTDIGWPRYEDILLRDALKEQIIYNVAEKERLVSQLEQLNRELEQVRAEEAMTAQEQAELEPYIVSDAQYRNGTQLFAQQEELAQKTELYNKLSAEQKRNAAVDEAKRKKLNIIYSVIALAAAAAAFFFSATLIPALVMIIVSVIMVILILLNKQPHSYERSILDDEIAGLENSIATLSGSLDDSFDLEQQQDYRAQLTALDREQKIHRRKEVQLNNSLKKKQAAHDALADELQKIKEQLRLPAHFEDSLLHHAYRAIGKMQQLKATIDELKVQYITEQSAIETFRTRLIDSGLVTNYEHLTMAFQELSALIKSEDKKRAHKLRQDEQLALSERELAVVRTSADELNNEIAQLFADAAVDNEADYYLKFADYKQYKIDFEHYQQLSRKLEDENFTYEMNTELAYTSAEDLRKSEADISDQVHELKEALQKEQFELHQVKQKMAELEQDTTLSELGYQYAIEREIVNRLAKEYGALNYIKTLIASHRQNVKEERIPHIISEASHIFSTLTEGRYIAVTYKEELLVKHKDGQVYHPTELSQSTKELLYIAMRLSLIQHLHQLYPLPIIIDDAFVHFDKQRKEFIIDYLMKKDNNQVLYFTPNRSTNIPGKNTLVLERHDKETK